MENFTQLVAPRLRSRVYRVVLGKLLIENDITAPFILDVQHARGLVEIAKFLEFHTYGPEEMITY